MTPRLTSTGTNNTVAFAFAVSRYQHNSTDSAVQQHSHIVIIVIITKDTYLI